MTVESTWHIVSLNQSVAQLNSNAYYDYIRQCVEYCHEHVGEEYREWEWEVYAQNDPWSRVLLFKFRHQSDAVIFQLKFGGVV